VGLITGVIFGTGITAAFFQQDGTVPSLSELWKMTDIGLAMICDKSFKIQFGILSGLMAFLVFMLSSYFSIVSNDIIKSLGRGSTQGCWISDND
jgi:hypothetical protein